MKGHVPHQRGVLFHHSGSVQLVCPLTPVAPRHRPEAHRDMSLLFSAFDCRPKFRGTLEGQLEPSKGNFVKSIPCRGAKDSDAETQNHVVHL